MPPEMVTPDREMPGNRAKIWQAPMIAPSRKGSCFRSAWVPDRACRPDDAV